MSVDRLVKNAWLHILDAERKYVRISLQKGPEAMLMLWN
jgi:hypothetical protein